MSLHRVFFDSNNSLDGVRYDLGLPAAMHDLSRIPDLRDGVRVIICMPNELEMEAILEYDQALGRWGALPIEGTIRYLDGS